MIQEENKKNPKEKKKKDPFSLVMKRWFFGLKKEFGRMDFPTKWQILKDFITIIIVCAILASLFFGIDMIVISIQK